MASAGEWFVYMVRCSDGSLYTGITTDVERRFSEHEAMQQRGGAKRGAKYFLGRRPLAVVFCEGGHNRISASRREAQIKQLPAHAKWALLGAQPSG